MISQICSRPNPIGNAEDAAWTAVGQFYNAYQELVMRELEQWQNVKGKQCANPEDNLNVSDLPEEFHNAVNLTHRILAKDTTGQHISDFKAIAIKFAIKSTPNGTCILKFHCHKLMALQASFWLQSTQKNSQSWPSAATAAHNPLGIFFGLRIHLASLTLAPSPSPTAHSPQGTFCCSELNSCSQTAHSSWAQSFELAIQKWGGEVRVSTSQQSTLSSPHVTIYLTYYGCKGMHYSNDLGQRWGVSNWAITIDSMWGSHFQEQSDFGLGTCTIAPMMNSDLNDAQSDTQQRCSTQARDWELGCIEPSESESAQQAMQGGTRGKHAIHTEQTGPPAGHPSDFHLPASTGFRSFWHSLTAPAPALLLAPLPHALWALSMGGREHCAVLCHSRVVTSSLVATKCEAESGGVHCAVPWQGDWSAWQGDWGHHRVTGHSGDIPWLVLNGCHCHTRRHCHDMQGDWGALQGNLAQWGHPLACR
ncbi:hypothetical protein EI94DRAFT_1703504 [Lactarius quietus]|nr:hypothetical protein EI94DRAFT_1703504 [Lactarius quietus]